jgi:hypothetical protein
VDLSLSIDPKIKVDCKVYNGKDIHTGEYVNYHREAFDLIPLHFVDFYTRSIDEKKEHPIISRKKEMLKSIFRRLNIPENLKKEMLKNIDDWTFKIIVDYADNNYGYLMGATWRKNYGFTGQNAVLRESRRQKVNDQGAGYIVDRRPSLSHIFKRAGKAFLGFFNGNDDRNRKCDVRRYTGRDSRVYAKRRNIYTFERLDDVRDTAVVWLPGSKDVFERCESRHGFIQHNLAEYPALARGYGKRFGQVHPKNSDVRLQSIQPADARGPELVHLETIRLDQE